MIDIEQALTSPATIFETPEAVRSTPDLSNEQRLSILRQWSYDLRELLVASDENMAGGDGDANADLLARVDALLKELDPDGAERSAPNMQGGV